ncbi:hypothetical protein LTR37_010774 [Vermiconidia calcicola]|uniref:Uncharacterized protein n=1 Tax=Vermiconidia calcicola TaxID=1690605 RepID=A0ACC3N6Q2_9PEZI|nr:hypothetical protein LTR37_010774 [Vermiconidia calcicola]
MSSTKFTVTKHTFPGQHIRHYAGATRSRDEDMQYLEAKQYTPLGNGKPQAGDTTIISTCANGFPKEMYEPLFDELLTFSERNGVRIRSIWSVDKSDHGASGIINERSQGDDPSYFDLARDLLLMINRYRDQMTLPIVGIGHSLGATALLELTRIHPRLFSSLILIDPIIGLEVLDLGAMLVHVSSRRRDLWQSREEAEGLFKLSKPLQKWDPRVMKLWLEYGLRDTPTLLYPELGNVTLRTTKATEVWNYARSWFDPLPLDGTYVSERSLVKHPDAHRTIVKTHPFYLPEAMEAWRHLPHVRCSVLYLFPETGPLSSANAMEEKVARTGNGEGGSGGQRYGRTSKIVVEGMGHLAPFEKPDQCARAMAEWLAKDIQASSERTKYERENRDDKSVNKVALSDEWVRQAKLWFDMNVKKASAKAKL